MIFNSLGSNYSSEFVRLALHQLWPSVRNREIVRVLTQQFEQTFNGKLYLTYKGRDAIELSLKSLKIGKGDSVLTQAFTCFAIEEGITRSGAKPFYIDLGRTSPLERGRHLPAKVSGYQPRNLGGQAAGVCLNPSMETLKTAYQCAGNPKAVLIQHTLGYPADIRAIKEWCQKKNLILIEDLAQAYGAVDSEGKPLGSYGDVVIFSYGRDKILDATSGGGYLLKINHVPQSLPGLPPSSTMLKDLSYPFVTQIIRNWYSFGIGKGLHWFLKQTRLMTNPIESFTFTSSLLPSVYAPLVLYQLQNLEHQLGHRRKIALQYYQELKEHSLVDQSDIAHGSNLRFPVWVEEPQKIILELRKNNIHLADRWYRKPVDFGSLNKQSIYKKGLCPNAETLADHILNLPTHIGIDEKKAQWIAQLINQTINNNLTN